MNHYNGPTNNVPGSIKNNIRGTQSHGSKTALTNTKTVPPPPPIRRSSSISSQDGNANVMSSLGMKHNLKTKKYKSYINYTSAHIL